MNLTFFGVRGSTPCSGPDSKRYGGNTSCVVLDGEGFDSIVFDLGTGLRYYGEALVKAGQPFQGLALVTHLHWDHIQGLPFFRSIHAVGARLEIVGPPHDERPLSDCFTEFMRPPYFPVSIGDLGGSVTFRDLHKGCFAHGAATVMVQPVPHVGATNGYRVDAHGMSVAYISDHQQPLHDESFVDPHVIELARDADLLIHDAQYTSDEFAERTTWGHCTIGYALEVAIQARVKTLVLFHHDPLHHDAWMDGIAADAAATAAGRGLRVLTAQEGMQLQLHRGAPVQVVSAAAQ